MNTPDAIAEVSYYDNIRETLEQADLSESEKRRHALTLSLTAKNQYEALKEMGANVSGLADFLNTFYPKFTVVNRRDTRATLNNGQLEETPVETINENREFYEERPSRKLFSLSDNELRQREDGYQIADDNETVDVVTIPENAIPDFKTKRELVTFIKNILGNERNITIKSTGDTVLVSNAGINRAVVKTRRSEYNEVFGAVRQLLENAKYSGFVEADERHQNVRGQDIYHSGLVIGTKPYSVMFKVDIPKVDSSHNYAGHKISDIRIAPSENANGYLNSPHTDDAIREVSLAVLRGKVNPARQKNNKLYQRAYAASRVDYDRPSLKAIGSGTGDQTHARGLYYALERDTAEGYYDYFLWELKYKPLAFEKQRIAALNTFKTRDGKSFLDSYKVVPSEELFKKLYDAKRDHLYGSLIDYIKSEIEDWKRLKKEAETEPEHLSEIKLKRAAEADDYIAGYQKLLAEAESGLKNITMGQVHEVEIPENPYLLDEDKTFNEQPDYVKERLRNLLHDDVFTKYLQEGETLDDFAEVEIDDWKQGFSGWNIYKRLSDLLGNDEAASLLLDKYGIKGTTYVGKEDGRCFVIFNPDNVEVIDKFYSQAGDTIRGTYDPGARIVEIFADESAETVAHELSHYFFQGYFEAADKYGYTEKDRSMLRWLSKQGKHEIKSIADMRVTDWENLTEAWLRYLNTGNAPTIATRGIFQKAKEWVFGVYEVNRDYASDEVKDFFDNLISREGKMPDINALEQNINDIKEGLKRALKGESATFRNADRKMLKDLRRGIHRRIRRKGRTLAQQLRSFGYKVDTVNGRLLEKGTVVEDDVIAPIFKDLGIIENIDTDNYDELDALSTQMQNILQDAETFYSPRESVIQSEHDEGMNAQYRLLQIVDDLLKDNQLGIKTIEELDELLARIESKPDNVDIVKVNRDAIKYLQHQTNLMIKNVNKAIEQVRKQEKTKQETQYLLQERITKFINSLPITGNHKMSLTGNIKRVKDADSFEKVLKDVSDRAQGYMEQEQKQLNRNNIEQTIKSTRPTKFRKQRYTYEDNKFFAELRDILKMTKDEASKAQEEFAREIGLDRADGDIPLSLNISEYDRLKNLLYNYKINGAASSLDALQDLATSLEALKMDAILKRFDEEDLAEECFVTVD